MDSDEIFFATVLLALAFSSRCYLLKSTVLNLYEPFITKTGAFKSVPLIEKETH